MVDTCTVTITVRNSRFQLRPFQVVTFQPAEAPIDAEGATLRLRTTETVTADAAGTASIALVPGPYILQTQDDEDLVSVPMMVPDQAAATIGDCIDAVGAIIYNALAVALLSAGLRFFLTSAAGQAAPEIAVGGLFVAQTATGLTLFEKGAAAPTNRGPVFPGSVIPPGSAGTPGLSISGDADTGLYAPAANQLAAVVGGALGWLLTSTGLQVQGLLTGTAVTQSQQDVTAGRLLKNGDHGLSSGVIEAGAVDYNTLTVQGRYFCSGTVNRPGSDNDYFFVDVIRRSNGILQIATSVRGLFGNGRPRTFQRMQALGAVTWTAWSELYSQASIVGPVAQAAGIPTGAIIERGSKANGEYIRYADGTQICWIVGLAITSANTADGALYRSNDSVWTYPMPFLVTPAIAGGGSSSGTHSPRIWLINEANCNVRHVSTVSTPGGHACTLIAIGRWF